MIFYVRIVYSNVIVLFRFYITPASPDIIIISLIDSSGLEVILQNKR